MKLGASLPITPSGSNSVVRKVQNSDDIDLEFGKTLELETSEKFRLRQFIEASEIIELDGPDNEIDTAVDLNALKIDEALLSVEEFDVYAIKQEKVLNESMPAYNSLPLVVQINSDVAEARTGERTDVLNKKFSRDLLSQNLGTDISNQEVSENILRRGELKNKVPRVSVGEANFSNKGIDPGTLRNIKTASEASANSKPVISQAPADMNANIKVVNAINKVQVESALSQSKSVSAKSAVTIENETKMKIGEVKLERVAPANFNQLIIESISSNVKISPVATNTFVPGQISTQLPKTLTIQLLPDSLGVVEVKISNTNGRLSISIETSTLVAEKILKVEIAALADKMIMSGIAPDEMMVRNNPNLEFIKDGNTQERQSSWNLDQSANDELAKNGNDNFQQQLLEPDTHKSESTAGVDTQTDKPYGGSTQRNGIYL
ncbi:MAG: flagellar hook-length control protein FliK [Hyphomicrobiales bacterium]|nr:flagellar hook-length control protein FliK [Hyphomicrobiales bacterium]